MVIFLGGARHKFSEKSWFFEYLLLFVYSGKLFPLTVFGGAGPHWPLMMSRPWVSVLLMLLLYLVMLLEVNVEHDVSVSLI